MSRILDDQSDVLLCGELQRCCNMIRGSSVHDIGGKYVVRATSLACFRVAIDTGSVLKDRNTASIRPLAVKARRIARMEL